MKVLSLLQPWASLWVSGKKRIETRSWGTSTRSWGTLTGAEHRGRIAVAASKKFGIDQKHLCTTEPFASVLTDIGHKKIGDIPLGVILGWVTVTDCLRMVGGPGFCIARAAEYIPPAICLACDPRLTKNERAFGNYAAGRWAWLTSRERFMLLDPIPFKGSLGLRDLPADIAARLAS